MNVLRVRNFPEGLSRDAIQEFLSHYKAIDVKVHGNSDLFDAEIEVLKLLNTLYRCN